MGLYDSFYAGLTCPNRGCQASIDAHWRPQSVFRGADPFDPGDIWRLAVEGAGDRMDQDRKCGDGSQATRFSQREAPLYPAVALGMVCALHHPAPEHREPECSLGPVIRGIDPCSATNVHKASISRFSVRASLPASSCRYRDRPISWTMRAYQICTALAVGGACAQCTDYCNSASTRRPNHASSESFRLARPRARRIRWARQVCRPWTHCW
jgi:hypothetical protein